MPIHIERLTSEVTIQDGDLGLAPAQIEKLVGLVIAKLEDRAREARRGQASTKLARQASKPLEVGE